MNDKDNVSSFTSPPFIALITEPDACDDEARMLSTVESIQKATSTGRISLVSIRIAFSEQNIHDRVVDLIQQIQAAVQNPSAKNVPAIVVSSDWIDQAIEAKADGIHVKESHRSLIPEIRTRFGASCLIGTSSHSIESAVDAHETFAPDYLFVGTCYATASHPEKNVQDLEGPLLPGKVQARIACPVLAIGGIDTSNCEEPIRNGASGIATIRAILCAPDPAATTESLWNSMRKAMNGC